VRVRVRETGAERAALRERGGGRDAKLALVFEGVVRAGGGGVRLLGVADALLLPAGRHRGAHSRKQVHWPLNPRAVEVT